MKAPRSIFTSNIGKTELSTPANQKHFQELYAYVLTLGYPLKSEGDLRSFAERLAAEKHLARALIRHQAIREHPGMMLSKF